MVLFSVIYIITVLIFIYFFRSQDRLHAEAVKITLEIIEKDNQNFKKLVNRVETLDREFKDLKGKKDEQHRN